VVADFIDLRHAEFHNFGAAICLFDGCGAFSADSRDLFSDLIGCIGCSLGELAHFIGDEGKAAAMFAGAGGYSRGIEREKAGLSGDVVDDLGDLDDLDDLDDAGALFAQRENRARGCACIFLGFLHLRDRGGDGAGILLACFARVMSGLVSFDDAYGTSELNLRECLGESTLARSRLESLLPRQSL